MAKYKDVNKMNIVIETRLSSRDSFELIEYFENYISLYNKIFRFVWSKVVKNPNFDRSKLNTEVQVKYGVLKRTANSVIGECIGRLNALKELKLVEVKQRNIKILELEKEIKKLSEDLNFLKSYVVLNQVSEKELDDYRKLKKRIYYRNLRLNKYRMRNEQLEKDIDLGNYKLMFGSKDFFKKQDNLFVNGFRSHEGWKNAFVKNRDKNIDYLGCAGETCGNQMFQLIYDLEKDNFSVKLRGHTEEKVYFRGGVNFKYNKEQLIKQLEEKRTPLTYKIARRSNKWYLQVVLTLEAKEEQDKVSGELGVFGLDYNDGFISMVSVDSEGNLGEVYEDWKLDFHGTGNKAKSEIKQVIGKIMKLCLQEQKAIVIEDLDFKSKKSQQQKGKQKNSNKKLHLFDYSRYKRSMEVACFRNGIEFLKINPYNTSKLGQKFIKDFKVEMSSHQAAAYFIGRRGLGFKDVV